MRLGYSCETILHETDKSDYFCVRPSRRRLQNIADKARPPGIRGTERAHPKLFLGSSCICSWRRVALRREYFDLLQVCFDVGDVAQRGADLPADIF